uniref:G2/mitotic-specific cyclin-B2 n=1 Tax=Maylandia zebra TaxID=106582 RepID=A0A3P9DEU3_9CICH|nr:cyclin-A1 [Maylandia zebra]
MMNFSKSQRSRASKENMAPSARVDTLQRSKQRTVLGVLSENELRGRSLSQGGQFSRHSSTSESSQLNCLGCPSSSSFDVYVEEACEVVLAASGEEVVGHRNYQDEETNALHSEDMVIMLELSSSPCQDASTPSESEEVFCVEYARDIHQHLRNNEIAFRPRPKYLERHPEITDDMRVVLVDWMAEVAQEFQLQAETLHLAINYLDRFLSLIGNVKRGKLQLVGTAALVIAAKYEEKSPPKLDQFVTITDNTYTKKQLLRMEQAFLSVLGFNLAAPTINSFLHLFMAIQSVCANTKNLALYVAELSLLEMDPFLQYSPSMVAAAAYCLASYTINTSLWPDSLVAFSGYTMADISPCLTHLYKLYASAESRPLQGIREKYKNSKYCGVSWITPPAFLFFP